MKVSLLVILIFFTIPLSAQNIADLSEEQRDSLHEAYWPVRSYSTEIWNKSKEMDRREHVRLDLYLDTIQRYLLRWVETHSTGWCAQILSDDLSSGMYYEKNDTLYLSDKDGKLSFSFLKSNDSLTPLKFADINTSFGKGYSETVPAYYFYGFGKREDATCYNSALSVQSENISGVYGNNRFNLVITGSRFNFLYKDQPVFTGHWEREHDKLVLADEGGDATFVLSRLEDGSLNIDSRFFGGCKFYKVIKKE